MWQWLYPAEFSHPDVHRPPVVWAGLEIQDFTWCKNHRQTYPDTRSKICWDTKKSHQPTTDPGTQAV